LRQSVRELIAINKESHAYNKETRGFFKLIEMARMYREMGDMERARAIMVQLEEKKEKEDRKEKEDLLATTVDDEDVVEVLGTTTAPVGEVEVVTGMEPMSSITTTWSPIDDHGGHLVSIVATEGGQQTKKKRRVATPAESQNLLESGDDDSSSSSCGEDSRATDELVSSLQPQRKNNTTTIIRPLARHSQLVANLFDDTQGSTIVYGNAKDL
jgi:hypothetical protein